MSQKVERHSIVPRCPVLKYEDRYKLIKACKYHNSQINCNLLGFINMHPVHEGPVTFDLEGSVIEIKELSSIQKKSSQDIENYGFDSLQGVVMDVTESKDSSDDPEDQINKDIRGSNEMILTVSREPKTYSKKVKVGTSPTDKVSESTHKDTDKKEKSLSKIKEELPFNNQSDQLPVVHLVTKDMIQGLKTQKNVKFLPVLKLNKDTIKIVPSDLGGQNISLRNKPVEKKIGKTSLKAEIKLIANISKPNNITDNEPSTKTVVKKTPTNLQGKKIVIVTKNDNIMLKPLASLSNPKSIILKDPVKSMQTLNMNKNQIGASRPNILKKVLITGPKQVHNSNLKTDKEKNNDKIIKTADNDSCSNHNQQAIEDKNLIKGSFKESDDIVNKEEKLVNNYSEKELESQNVSDAKLNKELLKGDSSNNKLNNDELESNYYIIMDSKLSKDAITEIILGNSSYNPPKSTLEDKIEAETKGKDSPTPPEPSKPQIISINPPKSTPEVDIAVATEETDLKTPPEERKRQIASSTDNDSFNNKRLCLSKPTELNDKENIESPVKDNANKTNNTAAADIIGLSPTYQHKDATYIVNPTQSVLPEFDLFGNDLENFDDYFKDVEMFDIIDSNMQSAPLSWGPLLIDEDIPHDMVNSGNHTEQNKMLHGCHRVDPFLTEAKSKSKYKTWQLMFFLDMKLALRKDFAGNMPIHEAVLKDDMKTLHKQCLALMARIKTIDVRNNEGSTPLHLAILNRVNPDVISVLLKFNASVTVTDNEGNNAFHLAAYSSDVEYVRRLLECSNGHETRCDVANFDGLTPLMISVLNNDYVIVEQLLLGGFSPNLRDQKSGRTALFHAVEQNNEKLVKLLLDNNGDTRIENFFGTSTHDAVYELSNLKSGIKSLIHEKKKIERARKSKNSGSPKTYSPRNNSRSSPMNHVNSPDGRNYRTYIAQCKRPKIENED